MIRQPYANATISIWNAGALGGARAPVAPNVYTHISWALARAVWPLPPSGRTASLLWVRNTPVVRMKRLEKLVRFSFLSYSAVLQVLKGQGVCRAFFGETVKDRVALTTIITVSSDSGGYLQLPSTVCVR